MKMRNLRKLKRLYHTVKKLREIPMWTTVAQTKRRRGRKIPTLTSFGSVPPLSTSEFGAFRHGFFTVHGILQFSFLSPQELTCSPVATIFFVHIFWVSHYFEPLPPLRGQRTITLYGNRQFAVGGSARFDPGTSASQSNEPPLRHLSSSLQICVRFCRLIRSIRWFPTERGSAKAGSLLRAVAVIERGYTLQATASTQVPGLK